MFDSGKFYSGHNGGERRYGSGWRDYQDDQHNRDRGYDRDHYAFGHSQAEYHRNDRHDARDLHADNQTAPWRERSGTGSQCDYPPRDNHAGNYGADRDGRHSGQDSSFGRGGQSTGQYGDYGRGSSGAGGGNAGYGQTSDTRGQSYGQGDRWQGYGSSRTGGGRNW